LALRILKNKREIVASRKEMRREGIDCADGVLRYLLKRLHLLPGPRLGDRIKSWDVLRTVRTISQRLGSTDAILDLGAFASELLPALNRSGFSSLTGIDLNPLLREMPDDGPIRYIVGDFYKSDLPAASFSAITAISVIEHGFDSDRLWSEVSRLLKPEGYFIASVDYWSDKIDTAGIKAFGLDWMIFSQADMERLLTEAARYGLVPVGELDFASDQAPIRWQGKSYTFAWFALQKLVSAV
jgi:SAM-dependent methyltransferase